MKTQDEIQKAIVTAMGYSDNVALDERTLVTAVSNKSVVPPDHEARLRDSLEVVLQELDLQESDDYKQELLQIRDNAAVAMTLLWVLDEES